MNDPRFPELANSLYMQLEAQKQREQFLLSLLSVGRQECVRDSFEEVYINRDQSRKFNELKTLIRLKPYSRCFAFNRQLEPSQA